MTRGVKLTCYYSRPLGAPMNKLVLFLLFIPLANSQDWNRSEYHDDLHNENGVQFSLAAKENRGVIEVNCSNGKLKTAWLLTDKVADTQVKRNLVGELSSEVDVEYRRDSEPKPHRLSLPVSKDFHGILLQRSHGFADVADKGTFTGLENLLYGPSGFG